MVCGICVPGYKYRHHLLTQEACVRNYLHSWGCEVAATQGRSLIERVAEEEDLQRAHDDGVKVKEQNSKDKSHPKGFLEALVPAFGQRRMPFIADIYTLA